MSVRITCEFENGKYHVKIYRSGVTTDFEFGGFGEFSVKTLKEIIESFDENSFNCKIVCTKVGASTMLDGRLWAGYVLDVKNGKVYFKNGDIVSIKGIKTFHCIEELNSIADEYGFHFEVVKDTHKIGKLICIDSNMATFDVGTVCVRDNERLYYDCISSFVEIVAESTLKPQYIYRNNIGGEEKYARFVPYEGR